MHRINCIAVCMLCLITTGVAMPVNAEIQGPRHTTTQGDSQQSEPVNPPDQAHRQAADAILQKIWDAAPGQPKFDAISAVVDTYKASDAATQNAIVWLCLTYMKDTTRGVLDRWPCCYVLSSAGCRQAIPDLIEVLFKDDVEAMRAVAAEALGSLYLQTSNKTIREALLEAAHKDSSQRVRDTIAKYVDDSKSAPVPNPPDDNHRKTADAILQQIWDAAPGQPKFDAINNVVAKYKQSDASTQHAVTWLCLTYMNLKTRAVLDRWPCCYVLSHANYQQAIPNLISLLQNDRVEAMRAVAAESLGEFYKTNPGNTAIRDALTGAYQNDSSEWVHKTIAKYIGENSSSN